MINDQEKIVEINRIFEELKKLIDETDFKTIQEGEIVFLLNNDGYNISNTFNPIKTNYNKLKREGLENNNRLSKDKNHDLLKLDEMMELYYRYDAIIG
ncbi:MULTISPECIES: hypothetical protein [Psychrilyobacter]|uniref:Uncharacterized protein n=1 Tax=Psychrilyobacter piezotolerans TaxID=2293438 RepID=A0ABX9KJN7_9FUSO|nr:MULTISPECIES: hypothetical protein [Psychrilyobacter]MCS5422777.1 hypothetical protein [Psychrilyobacter sp. S5]NDI76938.1 hypothetical protein [Psychrilyobacter piezotolerans]RDE64562.1 hypothetical protein DV867_03205 [Psychrilyobacter sp. S5]REI42374.1 hypothetical protein DYH56_03205 [Psychrilyobacter piezotolerans]